MGLREYVDIGRDVVDLGREHPKLTIGAIVVMLGFGATVYLDYQNPSGASVQPENSTQPGLFPTETAAPNPLMTTSSGLSYEEVHSLHGQHCTIIDQQEHPSAGYARQEQYGTGSSYDLPLTFFRYNAATNSYDLIGTFPTRDIVLVHPNDLLCKP